MDEEEECGDNQYDAMSRNNNCHNSNGTRLVGMHRPRPLSWDYQTVWNTYRNFVKDNRTTLYLVDDTITRLFYWMPQTPTIHRQHVEHHPTVASNRQQLSFLRRHRWREVCLSLLSLHRMIMDLALQDVIVNSYGTTMSADDGTEEEPWIHATMIRFCITALHDLMPTLLELCLPNTTILLPINDAIVGNDATTAVSHHVNTMHNQATWRLHLERLKFMLRFGLVVSYWRQLLRAQQQHKKHINWMNGHQTQAPPFLAGLLRDGGMFDPAKECHQHTMYHRTPGLKHEYSYLRRQEYCGRRTGLRVTNDRQQPLLSAVPGGGDYNFLSQDFLWLVMGEVWNLYRPLYWAQVEASYPSSSSLPSNPNYHNNTRLTLPWMMSIIMDLISLKCLQRFTRSNNPVTQSEWNRRKLKLLFYALRSPFWDKATYPIIHRFVTTIMQRIPWIGRILETYLWDWIYYKKHPWSSERD